MGEMFYMITIGNCGYESRHQTAFEMLRPGGTPDYTLLLVKTDAFFEIDGQIIETPPNTIILYSRNTFVHYGCRYPYFNDDWIHFEPGPEDLPFLLELDIPFNRPCPLEYTGQITEYARLITMEKYSSHCRKSETIDLLIRALLTSLSSLLHAVPDIRTSNKYYGPMNQIRMAVLNAPHKDWTIEEMSRTVHMSPSYFQHLYRELFGVSCIQDCIQARIKNACFYLRTTSMSVHSVSEFCGYRNELHFMRQFKKYTGMTPGQYRKSICTE